MTTDDHASRQDRISPEVKAGIVRRFVQIALFMLLQAAILFLSAGRLDWVMAWVFIGLNVVGVAINGFILMRVDPELIAERARFGEGAKDWDKRIGLLVGLPVFLAMPIVAGLDVRFGWSAQMLPVIHGAGVAFWALGFGLVIWAMASNRFFSGVVRIQRDRQHAVMTGGPYRYVRHPGYVGMTVLLVASPLVLGSWWALAPAAILVILLIVRTAFEDRMLMDELAGYRDYAARVRYRLLPGVW